MSEAANIRGDFLSTFTQKVEFPIYLGPDEEYELETSNAYIVLAHEIIEPPEFMAHIGAKEQFSFTVRTDDLDIEFALPAKNGQLLIPVDITNEAIYVRYATQAYAIFRNYFIAFMPAYTEDEYETIDVHWINPRNVDEDWAAQFRVNEEGNIQMMEGTEMQMEQFAMMRSLVTQTQNLLIEFLAAFREEERQAMVLYEDDEDFDDNFDLE